MCVCLIFSQLLILYYQYFLLRLSKQKQWVDCPGVGYPMFQTTAYENLIVDSQQRKSLWVSKPKHPSSTMPMGNSVEESFSSSHEHQKSKKCRNWLVDKCIYCNGIQDMLQVHVRTRSPLWICGHRELVAMIFCGDQLISSLYEVRSTT